MRKQFLFLNPLVCSTWCCYRSKLQLPLNDLPVQWPLGLPTSSPARGIPPLSQSLSCCQLVIHYTECSQSHKTTYVIYTCDVVCYRYWKMHTLRRHKTSAFKLLAHVSICLTTSYRTWSLSECLQHKENPKGKCVFVNDNTPIECRPVSRVIKVMLWTSRKEVGRGERQETNKGVMCWHFFIFGICKSFLKFFSGHFFLKKQTKKATNSNTLYKYNKH